MKNYLLPVALLLLISCSDRNKKSTEKRTTMKSTIVLKDATYFIDITKPLDISLAVQHNAGVGAWYIDQPKITHVEVDGYVGKVKLGGSTNFNDVFFNPHSHGTHTECLGHITSEFYSINDVISQTFCSAQLISVLPQEQDGDAVITAAMFKDLENVDAVVIRTLPNTDVKKTVNYSNTNPPYLLEEVMLLLRDKGVKHVLIDLPSVDKEKDNGALLAHKAFWNYDGNRRYDATITELIYVPSTIIDGMYILDLQVAPIINDAAPSRPILYKVEK